MARMVSPTASEGGSAEEATQRKLASNRKDPSPEADAAEEQAEGDDDGSEDEYEIEEIIDAKRGHFPQGRIGYYVKWKGYGPEHNSWVDEQDAGNARDLIEEFWKRKKEKNKKKTQELKTPKSATKERRKSTVATDEVSDESNVPKKRGRPSTTSKAEKKSKRDSATDSQELVVVGNMSKYMTVPDWHHLIETVDTVEKREDGELEVFFTLTNGDHVHADSKLCGQRFPIKLLEFYESHLRWRVADAEPMDES